jgi:broad specificity phosphatase PhoE
MSLAIKQLMVLSALVMIVASVAYSDCHNLSLIVVRHGHAEHLLDGKRNSQITSEPKHLTKLGVEQVVHTAKELGIKESEIIEIYSSPLIRALETAAVFFRSLPPATRPFNRRQELPIIEHAQEVNLEDERTKLHDADIRDLQELIDETPITSNAQIIERDFGSCEGTVFLRGKPEDCYHHIDETGQQKGLTIETNAQIEKRVTAFVRGLKDKYCQDNAHFNGRYILVSTHDVTAKEILRELTGRPAEFHPADAKIVPLREERH